jgi:hypothetical protein
MAIIHSMNVKRFKSFDDLAKGSWNKAVGICPIGQAKTFSTVTSSRTFAMAKALLKTISGFIWALITSPDRHCVHTS